MEDRCLETTHGRHLGVDVQWVPVVTNTVKEGLIWLRLFFLLKVWIALRHRKELLLDFSFVAEATESSNEKTRPDSAVELARLG